jgi:hypothetical protein
LKLKKKEALFIFFTTYSTHFQKLKLLAPLLNNQCELVSMDEWIVF